MTPVPGDMVIPDEVSHEFGQLLAERRKEAKMSQLALAKAVGLSRASITNIERGRQPVSLPTLYLIADILQKDVADLLPPVGRLSRFGQTYPRRSAEGRPLGRLSLKKADWLQRISNPRKQV